jgi:hypothetical protein
VKREAVEAVDGGGGGAGVAVAAEVVGAGAVDDDEDDVGGLCRLADGGGGGGDGDSRVAAADGDAGDDDENCGEAAVAEAALCQARWEGARAAARERVFYLPAGDGSHVTPDCSGQRLSAVGLV